MAERVRPNFKPEPRLYFFKAWRKHRGLTQEQLAERVGMSTPSVSQLERGLQGFTDSTLQAFAYALQCEPGDLLMRDPESPIWATFDLLRSLSSEEQGQVTRIIETFRRAA